MSIFSKEDLAKLEKLCRIPLANEERETLAHNLAKVIGAVKRLEEVDTEGALPCFHVIPEVKAPLREDEPEELLAKEDLLASAPASVGGFIKVPKVIQEGP